MTLLYPWWLAAFPAALALWWLRPRGGKERPVSALFLWRQVAPARARRSSLSWQPSGVRVPLILLLLAIALAGPRVGPPLPGPPPQGGRELATVPTAQIPPPPVGEGQGEEVGASKPTATPIHCDGELPAFLQQFLEEIGAPCHADSPWRLRIAPGVDPTLYPLLWDLGDPLLADAPGVPSRAREVNPPAVGPLDRVLARVDGAPAIVIQPTADGEVLVIGADLTAPGLREDPTLPLLLARWVEGLGAAPVRETSPETSTHPLPRTWRWLAGAALALLWLPIPHPHHRPWHLAATLPLAVALVAPPLSLGHGGGPRTLLLDISASTRQTDRDQLLAAASAALEGATTAGVVAVGERPEVWVPPGTDPAAALAQLTPLLDTAPPRSRRTALDDGLAAALAMAGAGDVAVVSDGRGNVDAPPDRPIHAVLLAPTLPRAEPIVLHVPSRVATGGQAIAVLQLRGPSDAAVPITWRSDRGEAVTQTATTGPDGWGEARVALAAGSGLRRILGQVGGAPPAATLVQEAGPVAVAVVSDTPADLPPLPPGLRIERIPAAGLAQRLSQAPPPAAIVLGDAAAERVGAAIAARMAERVRRDGVGLLLLGTRRGMAGGGYEGTALAPALPLLLDRPPGRAPVAVAVVLDRSGSMVEGAGMGLDLGVSAALAVRRGVAGGDRWALLAFDVAIHPLDPLGPPPDVADLAARLATLQGGGGTDPWRAVGEAADLLATAPEMMRHLVVITDGQLPEPPGAWQAEALTARRIALDLVQVGSLPSSAAAVALASATGGRIYPVANAAALPATIAVATGPDADQKYRPGDLPFQPTGDPAPFVVGSGTVAGHCPTRLADRGSEVLRLDNGAPLLALGRHGLGRVAAWTATAPELAARADLWRDLLAWLAPPPAGDGLECSLTGATLRVSYGDPPLAGPLLDGAALHCRIDFPDGTTQGLPLRRAAGGDVWTVETELPAAGTYRVTLSTTAGGPSIAEQLVLLEPDPEWAITPSAGKATLARLARESGGRFVAAGEPLPPPPTQHTPWPTHPPLLILAAAILLLSPRPAPWRRQAKTP